MRLILLCTVEEAMASIYKASYVSLHVRKSNKAAIALYRDTLGFEVAKVEKKYCTWLWYKLSPATQRYMFEF